MSFQIKGMTIGEGQPLICVPVMGETEEEIVRQASHLIEKGAKMIEWRVDAFAGAFDMNARFEEYVKLYKGIVHE